MIPLGGGVQLNNLASQSPTPRPTPTFQQPQQLPTQSTPLAYNGTVFSDPVSKKSKKWLIISITAAIILIFIAITIFFIVNNQTTNKKLAEDSFENFIGYLTNGNENNNRNSLLDFNANNFYAIDKFYYDRALEESANYFRQLSGYWQNYIQYTQITEEKEIYTTTISNGLSVVDLYVDKYIIPGEEVLKQYLTGGEAAARAYYLEYFAFTTNSDMEFQYMTYQDEYLNSLLPLINLYDKNGCVTNNDANEACIEEKGLYNSNEYQSTMLTAQNIRNYVEEIKDEIKIACSELVNMEINKNHEAE